MIGLFVIWLQFGLNRALVGNKRIVLAKAAVDSRVISTIISTRGKIDKILAVY